MKLIIEPDAGISPVVRTIKSARREIAVCIFRLDREEVERALGAAVQRQVRVRALIAHTHGGGAQRLRKLEERFLAAGVIVARSADDLLRYHGKYLVADDTLHVFAFNFTRHDIEKCRSFAIATRDRRTVQEALKLFEADRTRQLYTPSRSNLVVSPETARTMLAKFINGARKELAIYDARIQDPAMIKLLRERVQKGVRIRVIGGFKKANGEIAVRKLKGLGLHLRAIIRDGTRAFVGSQSLRKSELDSRREVGLLISNPSMARSLMKIFETDWDESKPEDKKLEKKIEKRHLEKTQLGKGKLRNKRPKRK